MSDDEEIQLAWRRQDEYEYDRMREAQWEEAREQEEGDRMSDVIEKMMSEYTLRAGNHPSIHEQHRIGMTAAARVLLDEALGPVTNEEAEPFGWADRKPVDRLLASRRARLLSESKRKRTPEERVTVQENAKWYRIFLDGEKQMSFEQQEDGELHGERYRLGLIAQLKINRLLSESKDAAERVTIKRGEMDFDEHYFTVYQDGEEVCCNMVRRHAEVYRDGLIARLHKADRERP